MMLIAKMRSILFPQIYSFQNSVAVNRSLKSSQSWKKLGFSFIQAKNQDLCQQNGRQPEAKIQAKIQAKNDFQTFPVESYEIGQRIDRYLKSTSLNWTIIQKFLRSKQIYILNKEGNKIKENNYKLQQGDVMFVRSKIADEMFEQKQNITKIINYEDAKQKLDEMMIFDNKNITILNKPFNYSVQGGDNFQRNLFSLMAARYKRQMVHVIHRIDKPTTGVLLFCKNLKTAQLIQSAIQSRKDYNKYYLALTIGSGINHTQEYIRCNIEWTNKHKARIIQSLQKQYSKDSITYYKKLHTKQLNAAGQCLHLLGLKLITGRKHQIRCHLSDYLNNSVLNDRKYEAVLLKNTDGVVSQNDKSHKQDKNYIFLHSLMTTIKNEEIAKNVFEIPEEKINQSREVCSQEIFSNNQNGVIMLKNGEIKIVGCLPSHWKKISKQPFKSSNNPNLQQIVLDYQLDEIEIAESIQKSEANLWKKHQPHKKVLAIK